MKISFHIIKRKIRPITVILLVFTLLWMVFILWNSTRTGEQSNVLSDSISESIKDKIENDNRVPPSLEGTEAIYSKEPQSEGTGKVSVNLYQLKIFIRKTAHLLEYMLLAFLSSLTLVSHGMKKDKAFLSTFTFGSFIAISDEILQSHTEGRSGLATDVFIDMCGCLIGIFLALCVFLLIYYTLKQTRNSEE